MHKVAITLVIYFASALGANAEVESYNATRYAVTFVGDPLADVCVLFAKDSDGEEIGLVEITDDEVCFADWNVDGMPGYDFDIDSELVSDVSDEGLIATLDERLEGSGRYKLLSDSSQLKLKACKNVSDDDQALDCMLAWGSAVVLEGEQENTVIVSSKLSARESMVKVLDLEDARDASEILEGALVLAVVNVHEDEDSFLYFKVSAGEYAKPEIIKTLAMPNLSVFWPKNATPLDLALGYEDVEGWHYEDLQEIYDNR